MGYLQTGAYRVFPFCQMTFQRIHGGPLHQRHHHGGGQNRQRAAAHGKGGIGICHKSLAAAF